MIARFAANSIFSPSTYAIASSTIPTIHTHLKGQCENIKSIIADVLEYKEYMSADEIKRFENIRESQYFYMLNAFQFEIMDNKQYRQQVAHELWKVYGIVRGCEYHLLVLSQVTYIKYIKKLEYLPKILYSYFCNFY